MTDDLEAAIRAASEAIEARPYREWPAMKADTSAWRPAAGKTIEVSYERAERDPTPVPQELPAGWTTVERLQAQIRGKSASDA